MGAKIVSNNGKKTLPGVHVPHHKNTNDSVPQVMPVPDKVYISLHMHMGAPCDPLVKKGDYVKVGQLIGSSQAFMSARTHSSVSGTVEAITTMTTSIGAVDQVVVIATDGKQEVSEEVKPPVVTNYQEFLEALKCSGLVGLGGAGFPAHVKFNLKDLNAVDTLVINAAECEPYITTDLRTMLDKSEMLFKGIKAVQKYMEINKVYIGIEDNKPQAIEKLRQECANDPTIEVVPLKAMYPKGAEKVIAYETGVIISNVTSMAFIGEYLTTGMPLITKTLTIDGSAIKEPKNVVAPIGATFKDIVDFCGGFKEEPAKLLMGGPMMGTPLYDVNYPLVKNNNALLAFAKADVPKIQETACIRCGRCVRACPMGLMPSLIETAFKMKNIDELKALKVNLCIECGCCAYACPAKRSLVVVNKLSKRLIAPKK